jgi:lysophospholipase L1-like esterase
VTGVRDILRRAAVFGAVTLVLFVVFEAGLRIAGGSEAAPEFQRLFMPDATIGYRLKPGAQVRFKTDEFDTDIAINQSGVRDDEVGPKAPDERRIVVLGDSLVMAVQVPATQTFCRLLQDRLNREHAAGGVRYRVINAGVQGYGPIEEYLFYKQVVRALKPDVVLVAVYVANDAIEALNAPQRIGAGANLPATTTVQETLRARFRRMTKSSMVLQILRLRAFSLGDHFGRDPGVQPALKTYLPTAPEEVGQGLRVVRDCLSGISALARADGARTGIVLIPARFQVDDRDFGYLTAQVAKSGVTISRNAGTDRFKESLAGWPDPVFDLLPELRGPDDRSRVFFERTAHLTPRGHEVVADALARFLSASGLVPTAEPAR